VGELENRNNLLKSCAITLLLLSVIGCPPPVIVVDSPNCRMIENDESQFNFFDPTDHEKMLLPQRFLTKLDLKGDNKSMLVDVDNVSKLDQAAKFTLPTLKGSFGKRAPSKAVEALSQKRIVGFVYQFLPYEELILQSRVSSQFYRILRRLPVRIVCSGQKASNFCNYIHDNVRYLSRVRAFDTLFMFHIGNSSLKETLHIESLKNLIVGFQENLFPNISDFHIVINPDTGENGIFELIDAMLLHPLSSLTTLNFSGSYLGEQATKKLSEIFKQKKFTRIKILDMSQNGTGEYGTRFMMGALASGNACDALEQLDFSRNNMGRGFRVVPKCLASQSLNPCLKHLNLSNNDIQNMAVHDACSDVNSSLPHNLRYLNLSLNPLGDKGASQLVDLFCSHPTYLVELNLSGIDGISLFAESLANAIKKNHLPALEILDISHNAIGRAGAELLFFALDTMNCKNLRIMNIAVNALMESGMNLLCISIRKGTFVNLHTLDITANNGNAAMIHLATILKQDMCPALRVLHMGKNVAELVPPPIFRNDFCPQIDLKY